MSQNCKIKKPVVIVKVVPSKVYDPDIYDLLSTKAKFKGYDKTR
jgi:hypothetical protein